MSNIVRYANVKRSRLLDSRNGKDGTWNDETDDEKIKEDKTSNEIENSTQLNLFYSISF